MDNVVKLKGEPAVQGGEATTKVVAFLREMADDLESGKARPVHKAILTVYEDNGDQVRVKSAFCNTRFVEAVGILATALNDAINES